MTEPSEKAMRFAVKWHRALRLDGFGTQILAKAYDEDMAVNSHAELVEALREAKIAFEYGAGCDEGVASDGAFSEILSWAGSVPASAYLKVTTALAKVEQP